MAYARSVQLVPLPIESNLRRCRATLADPDPTQSASSLGTEQPHPPEARALTLPCSPFVPSHGCITHESGAVNKPLNSRASIHASAAMDDLEDELDLRFHKGLNPDVYYRCPTLEVISSSQSV
jgi:hypothetical protein